MKYQSFDIPDNDDELANWLGQMVVSTELGALVHELATVSQVNGASVPTLKETLGESRDEVMTDGLEVLSRETLQTLLGHPRLLLELQEEVLVSGGAFWENTVDAPPDVLERGSNRLCVFLNDVTKTDRVVRTPLVQQRWFVALVTAAVVLLLVLVRDTIWPTPPKEIVKEVVKEVIIREEPSIPKRESAIVYDEIGAGAWGWATPGVLPDDGTGEDYFYLLADLGVEWFDETPGDAQALARRISEFRRGCSILMLAEHKPLKSPDRKWLMRSCRKWADELDQLLGELEDQEKDFELVRAEMDKTVELFVDKLRDWGPIAGRRDT